MGNYQRSLRMQLIQLESQRAKVLQDADELKRQIGLLDEVLSWDLPAPESSDDWTLTSEEQIQ